MKPIVVIKLGGSSLGNPETVEQLASLVKGYQKRRYRVVVVHGGGPAINAELTKRNITWQFINGQRQTTPEMMKVIDEVLTKQVNGQLVENLKLQGVTAVGLSGADAEILFCTQATIELMRVGQVEIHSQRHGDHEAEEAEDERHQRLRDERQRGRHVEATAHQARESAVLRANKAAARSLPSWSNPAGKATSGCNATNCSSISWG